MRFFRFCFLLTLFLSSPQIDAQFQKLYGASHDMQAFCAQQTNDGGFIICGNLSVDSLNTDIVLLKTNSNGDTLWKKQYGGLSGEYEGIVEQTSDGGYVVTGTTYSYGAGLGDVLVFKTDANGDTLWARTYGGAGDEIGQYIQQTFDNGYIVGAHSDTYGAKGDFYLLRLNGNGDTIWTRNYGGQKHDHGFCVQQTSDSGFILVGHSVSFGPAGGFYAVKTKSNGDTLWTRGYGGMLDSYCYSVKQTNDGYLLAGTTLAFGAGGSDAMVVKINLVGDTVWTKTYGTAGEEYFNCVKETPDGNFILVGSASGGVDSSQAFLVKIDPNGDTLWAKTHGGAHDEEGLYVNVCADSGYVVAGRSNSFSNGISEMYLIKTDKNGNGGCLSSAPSIQITKPDSVMFYMNTGFEMPATLTQRVAVGNGPVSGTMLDVCATFSIPSYSEKKFALFPSPATDLLYLQAENFLGHIVIRNALGQSVYNSSIDAPQTQVPVQHFQPGLYIVEALGQRIKFIKQ